jgi:hypothetical protein
MAALCLGAAGALQAADLKTLDSEVFDRLAKKAKESVNITLDGGMLKAAKGFIPSDEPDSAKIRKLIDGLTSVSVRSFEFGTPGAYTQADLDSILKLVDGTTWRRIIDFKEEQGSTKIYLLPGADKPMGVFVLAAEPEELTVVQIDGPISLDDLSSLRDLGVDIGDVARKQTEKK